MTVHVLQGAAYGDEGKGQSVDYLCSKHLNTDVVVRYGGGAQCAHTVTSDDGRVHTFQQFGSGTFRYVPTHLSRFVRVRPDWVIDEARALGEKGISSPLNLLTIDAQCLITTPYHQIASERAATRHNRGTCGVGVGQTAQYDQAFPLESLKAGDFTDPYLVRYKLAALKSRLQISTLPVEMVANDLCICMQKITVVQSTYLETILRADNTVIFEGHQGALLDNKQGTRPNVTSSDCRFHQADLLLSGYTGQRHYYAVMRPYMTRHGAGYFPTETDQLKLLREPHNVTNEFQGAFRRGWLDFDALNHGLDILGNRSITKLIVTHMDYLKWGRAFSGWHYQLGKQMQYGYITPELIQQTLGCEIAILGQGEKSSQWQSV